MKEVRGYNPYKFSMAGGADSHNSGAPIARTITTAGTRVRWHDPDPHGRPQAVEQKDWVKCGYDHGVPFGRARPVLIVVVNNTRDAKPI